VPDSGSPRVILDARGPGEEPRSDVTSDLVDVASFLDVDPDVDAGSRDELDLPVELVLDCGESTVGLERSATVSRETSLDRRAGKFHPVVSLMVGRNSE